MKNPRMTNRDYLAEARKRGWRIVQGKGCHINVYPPGQRCVAIRDGHMAELAPPVAMRSLRRP